MNKLTIKILPLILTVFLISGCYHAKVTTGTRASSEVYENKWAASWIGGLVPPDVVNVEKQCTTGVAVVETKHSFLNMLVGGLTVGIFTPMHITVTCTDGLAASVSSVSGYQNSITIMDNSSEEEILRAFGDAADRAIQTGNPVYVQF